MKTFNQLFMLALTIAATTVFASCSKDDDNNDQPKATYSKSEVTYSYATSQDVLNNCTVTVRYFDAAGNIKDEAMTSTTWTKTLTINTLPATIGFKVKYAFKASIDSTSTGSYSVVDNKASSLKKIYSDNTAHSSSLSGINSTMSVSHAKFPALIRRENGNKAYGSTLTKSDDDVTVQSGIELPF